MPEYNEVVVDIAGLSDPITPQLWYRIHNRRDQYLWLKATLVDPPPEYSDYTLEKKIAPLGGSTINHPFTRSKPTLSDGEYSESLTLRFELYRDPDRINLIKTVDKAFTIVFIDHTDPAFTVIEQDTFDSDVEGWALEDIGENFTTYGGGPTGAPALYGGHYISAPYSLRSPSSATPSTKVIYKEYTIPSGYSTAFLIAHFYAEGYMGLRVKCGETSTILARTTSALRNKWLRVATRIPTGTTCRLECQVGVNHYLDDIIIIAK